MWKDSFVVAIKVNDRFAEESESGKCIVPFNSEYTIRLKNRNARKAIAKVYIDGEEVNKLGSFILDANKTLDLERFVEKLDQGRRFKFVTLEHSDVKDKHDAENGCIEVHFQLVQPVEKPIVIEHHEHHDHYPAFKPWHPWRPWWDGPYYLSDNTHLVNNADDVSFTLDTNGSGIDAPCSYTSSGRGLSTGIHTNNVRVDKGATIKGSESRQKFTYSYIGELEQKETIIRLQLLGTTNKEVIKHYTKTHCAKCGKKYDKNDNFCSDCGEKK